MKNKRTPVTEDLHGAVEQCEWLASMIDHRMSRVMARVIGPTIVAAAMSGPALAALDCDLGSSLQSAAQKALEVQQGAELMDDINLGLGLIPSAIISERVREATESVDQVLGRIAKLREYCELLAAKSDPVEQYFKAVDLLFSSTPMAAWVSNDVEMARVIVSRANAIASGIVSDSLRYSGGAGVRITAEVYRYNRILWNERLTGRKLKDGNHLRRARLWVRRAGSSSSDGPFPLATGFDSAYPTAHELSLNLNDQVEAYSLDLNNDKLFVEFLWKNGQRSLVPLAPGFYKTGGLAVIFPFVIKNQTMVLDR